MPIRFKHGIEVDGSVTVDGQSLGTNAFNSTTIPTHTSNLTNDSGFITQAAGDLRYLQSVPRDVALGTTVLDRGVEFHDAGGDLSWAIGGNDRGGIGQVGQNAFVIRTRTGTRFQVGTGWAEEGTEMMTIDDSGRVGFTAPTPSTRFEIRDNGFTNNRLRIRNTSGASNSDASIELVNDDDGAGHAGGVWLARSWGWGNATLQLGGTTTGQWSGRYNINTTQKTYFENSGGVGIRVVPDTMLDVAGEITGRGGDTGLIFKSRNTSATGAPDQFKIEHNYGNVNISNPRGAINFTTGLQYGGASVATQAWVSGQSYATTSQLNSKADTSHKYHTFSNGQYYYDSYSQGNYLRMFTQTANFDQVRFEPYYNVESSSNGVDWTPFDGADSLMRNILDGNESTGYNLALENRALRFEIQRNSGWPTTALIVWQETWSGLARPDCTMSIETWDGSSWIMREANIAFNGSTTASNYGTHLYVSTNLHQGQNRIRVTVIYDDWSNNNNYPAYPTVPLRNFMILSNYSGHSILPYDWDYDQDMFIRGDAYAKGVKLATENFVSNYLPLSGGTINGDLTVNNQLTFNAGNVAGPSTTSQDSGSRIILYPQSSGRHYAIGIESSNMWFNSDGGYKFYNDSNNIASLSASGVLYVNGGNSDQWNAAYGWGNHADVGYLDEVPSNYVQWEYNSVDLDPNDVNRARGVISINGTNATTPNRPQNYNTIYTLGGGSNNTLQLATGSDYHDSGLWIRQYNFNDASPQGVGWQNWATVWTSNDFANNSANWNEAHGWGNHADAGYAAGSHNHSAADITSGNLSGDRLTWNSNDGFTGTYSIVWRATNDLYTSSWLQVRGTDDALLTRKIVAGDNPIEARSIGFADAGLLFQDNDSYKCIHPTTMDGTAHNSSISLGWSNNKWKDGYFAGRLYTGDGDSSQWNAAYSWGNHASEGYLTSLPSHNHDDRYYTQSDSDNRYLDATARKKWYNINAASQQAKRYRIARVYTCPRHWDDTWQNIEFELLEEGYSAGHVRYSLFGYYNGSDNQTLNLKVIDFKGLGSDTSRYNLFLGEHTPAGWEYSGQAVYYTDIYVDVSYYKSLKITADTFGHSYQNTDPTSGAAITVFYDNPEVQDITYTNVTKQNTYVGHNYMIWNSSNFSSTDISNWNDAYGWGDHAVAGYLTSYTETDTLATVVARGQETAQALVVTAVDAGNPAAAANSARLSGYGLLGNRGTFYLTNGSGGVVQIGNGATHNANPAASFGADLITFHRDLRVEGGITEASSIRFKENVVNLEDVTEKVEALRPVRYNKIDSEKEEIGLIAEEVSELFPEVIEYNEDGETEGINYTRLSVILLKSVQELTERINKLEQGK